MLIAHLEELESSDDLSINTELSDLEDFYREAKRRYDEDEEFAAIARSYVVRLQGGDAWCLRQWQALVDVTLEQNQQCYERLNVTLRREHTMGESLYNDMLEDVVSDLLARGLAVEDAGAVVVFLDEYKSKDGEPMGVIVRKRDGGYLYTTTDIACAKYRYETLQADRIMYVIDSRQSQHLQQAWIIARKADYLPERVTTEHHAFGMMLGKDGKPFKTRQGGTIKLVDLLQEGHERAKSLIKEKSPELDEKALDAISEAVGIGAIKYADLSKNRNTDYIFDWDNMLSFDGNTAPYLQYANTRIISVMEKSDIDVTASPKPVKLEVEAEQMLARTLVWFEDSISSVTDKGLPHFLCSFLYELARQFTRFYESCPINKDDVETATRISRLKLCLATTKVLELGFGMLGIESLKKM
jgi:arginyl-tRNA synthetase